MSASLINLVLFACIYNRLFVTLVLVFKLSGYWQSMSINNAWWKGCIIYQIYPRSFMDSNADGIGDLPGITSKLEYVASLGVDAIWVSPFFKSPMKDFGYDISDYKDVDPIFGNLYAFKDLLEKAHSFGLKVIIDQVLSHTSDQHPWFEESRQSRDNPKADWYVWADPKPDGTPPNNWLSLLGGASWTWGVHREQYYLHNFLESQPDLNFHNPDVRQAQLDNVKFWLDFGVDGFRLDVINFAFHDKQLRDNPVITEGDSKTYQVGSYMPHSRQRHVYDISRPETTKFLMELRELLDQYPGRVCLGEISDSNQLELMGQYTADSDKLHMAYTFAFLRRRSSSGYIREVIREAEEKIKDGWACWSFSNHDVVRCPTRWGYDDDPLLYPRIALAGLLCLRGTVSIYQGEELGLPEAKVPYELMQDPFAFEFWPRCKGRDGCRTPMVWQDSEKAGFTSGEPWLPIDVKQRNLAVESQENQPNSNLHFTRNLIAWRNKQPALIVGDIEVIDCENDILCWMRESDEQKLLVALNMTGDTLTHKIAFDVKQVLEGHGFDGRLEDGCIVLEPYQALFAEVY